MTRTQIIKRYNKLVEEIEDMEIYDGRNTVDQYQCGKCHSRIFTTYKDKGVTMRPSVGSFNLPCKSHYYITDNKVEWL